MTDKPLVILERSWHYRLYANATGVDGRPAPPPKTLCGYFWLVVFAPLAIFTYYLAKWTVFAAIERILRLGDVSAAIILSAITSSALTAWGLHDWRSLAVVLGCIAVGVVLIFLVALVVVVVVERREKVEDGSASSARLIFETLRAKKRKVCPLIEVRP